MAFLCSVAPLGDHAASTMTIPLSHYPNSEPTSHCNILIMLSSLLGSDNIHILIISLTRLEFEPHDLPKRVTDYQLIQPSRLIANGWCLNPRRVKPIAYKIDTFLAWHYKDLLSQCHGTSRGGRLSRAPSSRSGRSGNPKIVGSSPEIAGSKPGRVKSKTLKLIIVAS